MLRKISLSLSLSVCLFYRWSTVQYVKSVSSVLSLTKRSLFCCLFVCLFVCILLPTAIPIHIVRKYNRVASSMTSGLIPPEFSAWFVYGILLIIGSFLYISTIMVPPEIDNDEGDNDEMMVLMMIMN
jgi:uncharacterized membrane protein YidH (DUF202 family)